MPESVRLSRSQSLPLTQRYVGVAALETHRRSGRIGRCFAGLHSTTHGASRMHPVTIIPSLSVTDKLSRTASAASRASNYSQVADCRRCCHCWRTSGPDNLPRIAARPPEPFHLQRRGASRGPGWASTYQANRSLDSKVGV
jgi:hypothetical protein